jgi:serine protease Do
VTLAALGLTLLPEVLPRTPAYIERIQADSAAAEAQLRPDDLIVMVDNRLVQSVAEVRDLLGTLEADRPVALTILRGGDVPEMLEVVLGGRP